MACEARRRRSPWLQLSPTHPASQTQPATTQRHNLILEFDFGRPAAVAPPDYLKGAESGYNPYVQAVQTP